MSEAVPTNVSSKRRSLATPFRAAYQVILGDPMEEGRLSLGGLDRTSYQLAIAGLVALGGMLASSLLVDLWRRGPLLDVGTATQPAFLPQPLVPVTLVALFVAWLLILWGAFGATLWLRLLVGGAFLALNASLGRPTVFAINSSFALRGTPTLALWTYALVPALLVLLPEVRRVRSLERYVESLGRGVLVIAAGLFFATALWAQAGQISAGILITIPTQLAAGILSVENVLLPMVFISVLAIVELSYGITEAVTAPFWKLDRPVVMCTLFALLALKLWWEVGRHVNDWLLFFKERPEATVRTILGLALLVGLALLARRLRPRGRASERVKEGVAYVTALVLALPLLVFMLVLAIEEFCLVVLNKAGAVTFLRQHFPGSWVGTSSPLFWAAVLGVAIVLLLRSRRHPGVLREAALGLVVISVWAEYLCLPEAFSYEPGFDPVLFDTALTIAVALYVIVRWRALTVRSAVWLGALTGFSWLVSTQGDFLSLIGRLVGLPTTILLVVGVVYTLLTDSEFTRKSSPRLPRRARPLLWIGYLLLSATIVNWVLATHQENPIDGPTIHAFEFIGLPLAAWLLSWRPFARVEAYDEDEQG